MHGISKALWQCVTSFELEVLSDGGFQIRLIHFIQHLPQSLFVQIEKGFDRVEGTASCAGDFQPKTFLKGVFEHCAGEKQTADFQELAMGSLDLDLFQAISHIVAECA